jgi:hypothetical protein
MKFSKVYFYLILTFLILSGCDTAIDFVASGLAVMLIIGAILMFVLFLIGTATGILSKNKDGGSNFAPESLFVVIIFGIFLYGIFGGGCN